MITLEEHLKGSEVILGPRKDTSRSAEKLPDKSITDTLNTIHKAIVQFLNLSNKNIVEFKDVLAQKIREQDAQITSISNTVHETKKKYDALYDNVRRLEYKYRNLTYQQKGQQQLPEAPIKKVAGISGLLLAAIIGLFILEQAAEKIKARFNAIFGRKEEEQSGEQTDETKSKPSIEIEKPPIVKSEDLKIHASSIDVDGEIITIDSFYEIKLDAQKILFKADEISIESPQIIFQSNPIIDSTYGQWENAANTTQQFQSDAQHPPVLSSTPQFPISPRTQSWDEGVRSTPLDSGPNPTPTMPDDQGKTFRFPAMNDEINPLEEDMDMTPKEKALSKQPIASWDLQELGGVQTSIVKDSPESRNIEDRRGASFQDTVEGIREEREHGKEPIQVPRYTGQMSKQLGIENILGGKDAAPVSKEPLFAASQQKPEFKVQLGGMAAWASDNTGVFKPGMMANYAQKAAQGMVDKMPKEKFDKLPADVKAHVKAALEGHGNFDLNWVIRRTAPLMTREELEQTKKEMAEGSITLIEPEGWKTPDEQQQATPIEPPKDAGAQPSDQSPGPEARQPEAIPSEEPSRGPDKVTPAPSEKTPPDKTESPKQDIPPPSQQSEPSEPKEEAGPVTDDPEREPSQPSSGSYGGMRGGRDHNANICMI